MSREFAVVGGWAAANAGLALGLLAFPQPMILPVLIFVGAAVLVALFGLVAMLAVHADQGGVRIRQPHRARAAALAGVGVAVALTGLAYGWWISLFAVYPLSLALWFARGERLRPGTRPWPAVLDEAEPAGVPRFAHEGSSLGVAVPVPDEHPAHGPERKPPPAPPRIRLAWVALVAVRVLLRFLARAAARAVRRRR